MLFVGVIYLVSCLCREGEFSKCGCSKVSCFKDMVCDWIWGGCGDNIEYGYRFVKYFVDIWERDKNYWWGLREFGRMLMNFYNNEVGFWVSIFGGNFEFNVLKIILEYYKWFVFLCLKF